jgi:transposase
VDSRQKAVRPKHFQGPPYYYERVSVEEQNSRLRERLRRRDVDIDKLRSDVERLRKEKDKLERTNEKLRREKDELEKEIKEMRGLKRPHWAKPNKNPVLAVGQKKVKNKLGRPKGLAPNIRTVPANPDFEIDLVPKSCPKCRSKVAKPTKWHSHTQIELPEPAKAVVTKYNIGWCYCAECDARVALTGDKIAQSKYGRRLHGQVAYWKFALGLTLPKIKMLLSEQYGLELQTGQISAILKRTSDYFETTYEGLKALLKTQAHLYADETGWRNQGNTHWLWSFSNEDLSYYTIDRSRGAKVVKDTLGEEFNGILSSDFYPAYTRIKAKKQKCWTHLLRELRNFREKYPGRKEIVVFSRRVRKFYERAENLKALYAGGKNIDKQLSRLNSDTDKFIHKRHDHIELICLAKRLIRHRGELYTFIKSGVAATNNDAEREIRPAVLMRKTSYGNRSDAGARTQAVLMSVIRTCKKQKISFVEAAAKVLSMH